MAPAGAPGPTGSAAAPGQGRRTHAAKLQARAERVVAGAAPDQHQFRRRFLAELPAFLRDGQGATVTDVDGRTFIDLMGSYGPNLLGHRHPRVERAAARQRDRGDSLGTRAPVVVELAELLCDRFDPLDWVFFGKNGSDATAYALRVARHATGHSRVLVAEASYHTAQDWGSIYDEGVPEVHRTLTSHVAFNDEDGLRAAVELAGGDLAAIMLTPFHLGYFGIPELPTPAFLAAVREEADRAGAVVVLDDVRAGMRMHPSGSSHAEIGLDPDLVCWAKAIANGRALSVCGGSASLRDAADDITYLGTFFSGAVAQAACLATFRSFDAEEAFAAMQATGDRLTTGLVAAAETAGVTAQVSGVPAMALISIDGDGPGRYLSHVWSAAMARRGVIVHPSQPWYLCAALTDEQVDAVLDRAAEAFVEVAEEIERPDPVRDALRRQRS